MADYLHANHNSHSASLDSLPATDLAGLTDIVSASREVKPLSPGARELFQEASQKNGYAHFFAALYGLEQHFKESGLAVNTVICQSSSGGFEPTAFIRVLDSSGNFIAPGILSASRYISSDQDAGPVNSSERLTMTGQDFEDPQTGKKISFQIERFKGDVCLVASPNEHSADEALQFSVYHAPGNSPQVHSNISKWIESHAEHFSYIIEDVVLPTIQADLVERSGYVMGAYQRPEIDFEASSYDPGSGRLTIAAYMDSALETSLVIFDLALIDSGRSVAILAVSSQQQVFDLEQESF